jgi:hypothetical protein
MWEVMIACVFMHNMIVEDELDGSLFDQGWESKVRMLRPSPNH